MNASDIRRSQLHNFLPIGVIVPIAATLAALGVGLILIGMTAPSSILHALTAFWTGATGSSYAIGETINRASVFILVGSGFVLANRANLTNVGGEGQIAVGGTAAVAVALYGGIDEWGFGLPVAIPMVAGALVGGLWGGIAGLLKVKMGTNEVISTLLLTFIGVLVVYAAVQSEFLLRQPVSAGTLPESVEIPAQTQLPLLGSDPTSPMHVGIAIAVLLAVFVRMVLSKGLFGFQLKAVGANPNAARRAGMRVDSIVVSALFLSGAMGGLAGAIMIQGSQFYLTAGFSSGYGFAGLIVGLLSRGSAAGVVAAALLFGVMRSGGIAMEIGSGVPAATMLIIQGLIVIFVAGSMILVQQGRR
jgi:general nucleoside transport system permease protein